VLKKVKVEVQFSPQCPWVANSMGAVGECVKELGDIAVLKVVDVWRHPELARHPTVFSVYVNEKELPEQLGQPSRQLITEEIMKAAGLREGKAEVTVKPLTEENVVDQVTLCTKHHTYAMLPSEDFEPALKAKKKWLLKVMETFNPCALIAYRNREPYGFIEFLPYSIAKDLGFQTQTITEDTAVITCLLVRQKAWRMGVASELVKACIGNLRSRGFKRLEVRANLKGHWHPAALYRKMGFKTATKLDEKSCLMVYEIK